MIWLMETLKIEQKENCDNILRDKAFNIAKNPKYDGYKRGHASMVYNFFDKKSASSGVNTQASKCSFNNEKNYTNQLSETLKKDPKFKVDNHVRISKYKNIFAMDAHQIGLRKLL